MQLGISEYPVNGSEEDWTVRPLERLTNTYQDPPGAIGMPTDVPALDKFLGVKPHLAINEGVGSRALSPFTSFTMLITASAVLELRLVSEGLS